MQGQIVVISCLIFVTLAGMLFGAMGVKSKFAWLTPTTFAIINATTLLVALFLPTEAQIEGMTFGASFNPRAIVVGGWTSFIFLYLFSLEIPSSISNLVWGAILIPSLVGVGMAFLEINKQ